jgi:excisionase family DNA binding protein
MSQPSVFTPASLSQRWECSERHVRNLILSGQLPSFRVGGKLLRIRREDVERFECQTGDSQGSTESSASRSSGTESGHVTALAPLTRAKLSSLRQQSMRS